MTVRERYWERLIDCKYQLECLKEYSIRIVRVERSIKILLAILSSSSVAAWAIWQKYPMIWAVIIAICQVLSVVYDYLPYKTRISEAAILQEAWSSIYLEMEKAWENVNNSLSDDQINELCYAFLKKWYQANNARFKDDFPSIRHKIADRISSEVDEYFKTKF